MAPTRLLNTPPETVNYNAVLPWPKTRSGVRALMTDVQARLSQKPGVAEYEAAASEHADKVADDSEFENFIEGLLDLVEREEMPQLWLTLTGLPGVGKTKTMKAIAELAREREIQVIQLKTDYFMSDRESPLRLGRFVSLETMLAHYIKMKRFRKLAKLILSAGDGPVDIPLGKQYRSSTGKSEDRRKRIVRPKGSRLVILDGAVADWAAGPLLEEEGVQHTRIFLFAKAALAMRALLQRDREDGRPRNRMAAQFRELEILLPLMMEAMEEAEIIVDKRQQIEEKLEGTDFEIPPEKRIIFAHARPSAAPPSRQKIAI